MHRYKSHARTLDELRTEFLSDLQHRLDRLDNFLRTMNPSAVEQSRIARARIEVLQTLDYWKEIELWKEGREIQ